MKGAELVFIPSPGISHLVSTVQLAKLLVDRDARISITFLIISLQVDSKTDSYIESASSASDRIRFIYLPRDEPDPNQTNRIFFHGIENQKPHVKEAVSKIATQSELSPDSPKLAGFVLDMFCTTMIDVANEFGVPSYIFFTSGAGFLGLDLYIQELHDEQKVDPTEFKDSDADLVIPCLANPFPVKLLPTVFINKEWLARVLFYARGLREAKGIIVNTFEELETHAINSLSDGGTPPVYPVGPLLNLNPDGDGVGSDKSNISKEILRWLDDQPPSSVVFLCFGSMGSFGAEQVKEIASALERSGHRFLWALRQPAPKGKMEAPSDYANPQEVLPEGFLDRTAQIGKVIGWAPQVDILAHRSIGGFVSHCGWNSTLESTWFGVPLATWPMYAEQQFNAFHLVVELGLAVEITMDYRRDFMLENEYLVNSADIEKGIRNLMEFDDEKRRKLKAVSEKSRKTLLNGGSSYISLGRLIQDMIDKP